MVMIGIQGLDKMIFTELPRFCTIMVSGETGVLKSTFMIECIKSMLDQEPDRICLYCSLKDDPEMLIDRFDLSKYVEEGRIIIYDYETLLDKIPASVSRDNILGGIAKILRELKNEYGDRLSLFALDPINILWNQIPAEHLRRLLYHFFSEVSDLGTQNWIINERSETETEIDPSLPVHFLSDGIVELGLFETQNDVIRYVEIRKMRGVNHSLKRFQVSYKKNILKILGPAYEG